MSKRYMVAMTEPKRERPVSGGTLEADYILPLRHSLTTGLFYALALGVGLDIAIGTGLYLFQVTDLRALIIGPAFGVIAGFIVTLSEWVDFSSKVKKARWLIEDMLDMDLDKDNEIGEPQHIIVNGKPVDIGPQPNRHLADYHDWIKSLDLKGTTWRSHEPTMTRAQYEKYRDNLMKAEWAEWKDPENRKVGWQLTADPETIIKAIN